MKEGRVRGWMALIRVEKNGSNDLHDVTAQVTQFSGKKETT
jgi:hypothetical protein